MFTNIGCDKVKEAMLLDGCYLSIKGEMKLRLWDCPDNEKDKMNDATTYTSGVRRVNS